MGRDVKQEVTDIIANALEKGTPPWRAPMIHGEQRNPATGTIYKPLNSMLLAAAGHTDPRWVSPAHCVANGLDFKGAKKKWVVGYFDASERKEEDGVDSQEVGQSGRTVRRIKFSPLFNAEQVKGMPSLAEELGTPEFGSVEIIERLADLMRETGLKIEHGGTRACYYPALDTIQLPDPKSGVWRSQEDYYSTLLHEMGHSTGHGSRLNRPLATQFGTEAYAFEELIAETAATQAAARFHGMPSQTSFDNHAAYMASWLRILKSDKSAIFIASKEAFRVVDYFSSLMPEQTLIAERESKEQAIELAAGLNKAPSLNRRLSL